MAQIGYSGDLANDLRELRKLLENNRIVDAWNFAVIMSGALYIGTKKLEKQSFSKVKKVV